MKVRAYALSPSVVRGIAAVCAAVLITSAASTARAAGVVGTGSAQSCTDAALDTALADGGLVTFDCGPDPMTIDISTGTGTKTIAADTTFDGGDLVTISGGNSVRVFSVNAGINFTVQNLTIANGKTTGGGGGIYNFGTLTVTNSTVSNSAANPVAAGGGGSGGGIANVGTLTVTNSTFSGNSAGTAGGGIVNAGDGTLTVANSTFSGNSASGFGDGGGIANFGTLAVTNSTFSDNSASNVGGGIFNSGTLTVTNTIVANSPAGGNCGGSVTDGGHNIDDGTTCGFSGTSLSNTNPMLDPAGLANNGGPTQTIALQAGSPAIDAGDEAICAAPAVNSLDQRGFVRPRTGYANCSIGAYEYNSPGPGPVKIVGTGTAASCTDAALDTALAGGGSVTFDCGSDPVTIDISTGTGTKTIAADTTVDGGGLVTISGGNSVRVFSVNAGINFTVQNLTIANGRTIGPGGGIFNNGSLTVTNSTVSNNAAEPGSFGGAFGGGILNHGTLTVTNSTVSGNGAGEAGGIFNDGTLTVANSTFSGNSASNFGGGISNGGMLTVINSAFSGNSAGNVGGGIVNNGTLTVTNTIVANSAAGGNCAGGITDGGHNIDDDGSCGFSGTSLSNTNPMLDPLGLQSNGGPTQTIALQAGSPAIDAGDPEVCANPPVNGVDQRGYVRPGDGATSCSIGAYEYNSFGPPAVTATATSTATPSITPTPTGTPVPSATPSASPTLSPSVTTTAIRTVTRTPTASATPSPSATLTATAPPSGGGGCASTPTSTGSAGWWLLVFALLLAHRRRATRRERSSASVV